MASAAPRLHVLIARDAPRAVILRRGPSAWYHVMRWNLLDDTIEHGAWFKGRIYEQRCDLSPDGELLLYFALKGSRWGSSYRGAWSAVSRAPWLHALALWPQGHTWGGGGTFDGPRSIVLDACSDVPHPDHPDHGLTVRLGSRSGAERAARVVEHGGDGTDLEGRPIFVRGACLYRDTCDPDGLVADFSDLSPRPSPAPAWATIPLGVGESRRRQRRKARNRIRAHRGAR